MTFEESIPLAKQLAENQLKKGFDVEAFLILSELRRLDAVPESNIDEEISDIGKIFIDYYYNPNTESLYNLVRSFIQALSEIYHTLDDETDKSLLKSQIKQFIEILN